MQHSPLIRLAVTSSLTAILFTCGAAVAQEHRDRHDNAGAAPQIQADRHDDHGNAPSAHREASAPAPQATPAPAVRPATSAPAVTPSHREAPQEHHDRSLHEDHHGGEDQHATHEAPPVVAAPAARSASVSSHATYIDHHDHDHDHDADHHDEHHDSDHRDYRHGYDYNQHRHPPENFVRLRFTAPYHWTGPRYYSHYYRQRWIPVVTTAPYVEVRCTSTPILRTVVSGDAGRLTSDSVYYGDAYGYRAGGALLGPIVGQSISPLDESCAYQALEYAQPNTQVTWASPQQGYAYTMIPGPVSQQPDGQYCREYQAKVLIGDQLQDGYGTACRAPDGSWQVVN